MLPTHSNDVSIVGLWEVRVRICNPANLKPLENPYSLSHILGGERRDTVSREGKGVILPDYDRLPMSLYRHAID
jgi:hypothetical protein